MMRLTRRQLIQASVVAVGGMAFGLSPFTQKARAQLKEVVMLGIWPFTGPLADSGPLLDRGMKFAIEEWHGKVLGRPIKYITRDSETKAGAATRRVEGAIDSENVKFVIGPWSSGVALVEKYIKIAGQRHGIEFVGTDRMPLGTREFSGVVAKATAAKPDVLCLVSAVQDFILQVREAHNFGLAPKVALVQPWGLGSEEFAQLDAKTPENLWTGTNGSYTIDTPVAKKVTELYEKTHGIPPAMLRQRPTA